MRSFPARLTMTVGLLAATGVLFNVNCGSSTPSADGGVGGHAGMGGAAGHAGGGAGAAGAAGASAGAGGTTAGAGGAAGAAGATAGSGGAAAGAGGAGGAAAGASGSGGAAAGAGGHGGAKADGGTPPPVASFLYTFDTGPQGFVLNTLATGGNLAMPTDGGILPSVVWDGTAGNPSNGSLQVTANFTDYSQFVQSTIDIHPAIDATGKTIHVFVRLDSGAFLGGAQILAQSAGGHAAPASTLTTLTAGTTWKELTLDLTAAHAASAAFDPSQLTEISIQLTTGSKPTGAGAFAPVSAVFHIDSVTDGSGGTQPPILSHTFDSSGQQYVAESSVVDAGVPPVLTWDSIVGDPSPGSLELTNDFTDYNQTTDVLVGIAPLADLTGKILHAKVRLDANDGGATFPAGYVQLHASSNSGTAYIYASGPGVTPTAGVWTDVSFDLSNPDFAQAGFDPSLIVNVGLQIATGGQPAGQTFPGRQLLTFHLDSVVAQ
jgi:hypothetical protein